jgi:hypothetical protein
MARYVKNLKGYKITENAFDRIERHKNDETGKVFYLLPATASRATYDVSNVNSYIKKLDNKSYIDKKKAASDLGMTTTYLNSYLRKNFGTTSAYKVVDLLNNSASTDLVPKTNKKFGASRPRSRRLAIAFPKKKKNSKKK